MFQLQKVLELIVVWKLVIKKSSNVRFIDDFQTFHELLGMLNFKTDMIYLILRPRNETTQPKSHNFSCNKFSF